MSIKDPENGNDAPITPTTTNLNHNPTGQETESTAPGALIGLVDQEAAGLSAELSLAISNVKLCGVCNEKESKYKCSRCFLPYCSIVCSTLHKATHPAIESAPPPKPPPVETPKTNDNVPRPGTVAAAGYKGTFAALHTSEELKTLFKQYPHLPSRLDEINTATLPSVNGQDPSEQQRNSRGPRAQPWNQDQGLQNGVKALRRAREASGKDGEGVREFSNLILQIVSKDNTVDAAALIQKEVADENARIIKQLLNGEL